MLVILSGASGVGKNTIIYKLAEKFDNMVFFKNATTRAKRPGENMYYYLTNEEFQKKIENDELVEHEDVHGFFYGVLKSEAQKVIDNPETIYIRDIEVHGNINVRKYLQGKAKFLSIFIDAPDDVLMQRLLDRGESEERAKVRLGRAAHERTFKSNYDYIVENIDLEKAIDEIENIIKNF